MVWRQVKQDMVRNVMIELLELQTDNDEIKKFIGLMNWEREKHIIFPIEDAELITKSIMRMVECED